MGEPYADPPDTHRHRCYLCGYIWAHREKPPELLLRLWTGKATCEDRAANAAAHLCPGCGADERAKYDGPAAPECWHPAADRPQPEETDRGEAD